MIRSGNCRVLKSCIVCFVLINISNAFGQNVKIGATAAIPNASAMLDIDGITGLAQAKGLLTPRVTDAQRTAMNPLPVPAQGLIVYQTNTVGTSLEGLYYNISTTVVPNWVYVVGDKTGWLTTGNTGTVAGTNFIGTLDAQDFVMKTSGNAATNERIRILKTGEVIVNNTTVGANVGDVFSVYSNGTTNGTANTSAIGAFAINGYSSGTGIGIYGENTGTGVGVLGISTGYGVYGSTNTNSQLPGGWFENSSAAPALPLNAGAVGLWGFSNRIPSGTGILNVILGSTPNTVNSGGVRGVEGDIYSPAGLAMFGFNLATSGNAIGVQAQSASVNGIGVLGFTNTTSLNPAINTSEKAIYGQANGPAAITGSLFGVRGSTLSTITSGRAVGVYGSSFSNTGFGMYAFNGNTSGTGIIAGGNNVAAVTFLGSGTGAAFNGTTIGTLSIGQTVANGIGSLNVGNNGAFLAPVTGAGSVNVGANYGTMGFATTNVVTNGGNNSAANGLNGSAGGYFECQNAGTAVSWAYVGVREAAGALGLRKIIGNGTVNTIVKGTDNSLRAMSCPEAPENLFQDYGKGQLANGHAHIDLDPIFAKNIIVNAEHPLRVFVQLRGDCKGVYVTNENSTGFDVVELQGGNSSVSFYWTVTANRADEILNDGSVAKYSLERFAPAPGPVHTTTLNRESITSKVPDANDAGIKVEQAASPKDLPSRINSKRSSEKK